MAIQGLAQELATGSISKLENIKVYQPYLSLEHG